MRIFFVLIGLFLLYVAFSDTAPTGANTTAVQSGAQSSTAAKDQAIEAHKLGSISTTQTAYVTGSSVNVRSGPGTGHAVVGQVSLGQAIGLSGKADGRWQEIVFRGQKAWIFDRYVSASSQSSSQMAVSKNTTTPKRSVAAPTTREISKAKQDIISQSISSYQGSCPCPYNYDRGGRRCGGRSAWSRPGGQSPMCYESDISNSRVLTQLARRRGAVN